MPALSQAIWFKAFIGVLICYCDGFPSAARKSIPLEKFPIATNDHFTWNMNDGSYRFGMQGQDQWRIEKRYPNGKVYVRFSYRTPDGQIIDNSFTRGGPPEYDLHDEEREDNENLSSEPMVVVSQSIPPTPEGHQEPQRENVNEGEDFIEFPPLPRLAKPYGALAKVSTDIDHVDSNGIVDEDTNSIVIKLL